MSSLARTTSEEQVAAQTLVTASGQLLDSTGTLKAAADAVAHDAFSVSSLTEAGHRHLAAYNTGSLFHRALGLARSLAITSARILEAPVAEGRLVRRICLPWTIGRSEAGDPRPVPVLQCGSCASRGIHAAQVPHRL